MEQHNKLYWSGAGHITSILQITIVTLHLNPIILGNIGNLHWPIKGNVMTEEVTVTVGKCDMYIMKER
jgi:hypothetical protein